MLCSRGKYLLMVDADGATKFSDLAKMEEKMHSVERNGEGVIVGSRAQYHPEILSESEKVFLNLIYFSLIEIIIKKIRDHFIAISPTSFSYFWLIYYV